MTFLRKTPRPTYRIEVMRADIFMEYNLRVARGLAAVEWVALPPPGTNDPKLRPFLVALLYARILAVHGETRAHLFEVVDKASKQIVRDEGRSSFTFPDWPLPAAPSLPDQMVWPWAICRDPSALTKAKVYRATLLAFPELADGPRWGIDLKMAWGLEPLLAPASALIAIASYASSTDQEGRYEMAVYLWQVNAFYGEPGRVSLGSESNALAAASAAIRSGGLRVP